MDKAWGFPVRDYVEAVPEETVKKLQLESVQSNATIKEFTSNSSELKILV